MEYLYETKAGSYEDYASGRVLYNAPGVTSFPVRLGSEIVQRCFDFFEKRGNSGPYTLYDPCCGGAYLLTVTGFLHGPRIRRMYASDVDPNALSVAGKNLALLTKEGLRNRELQLRELYENYGKPSHKEALESLDRFKPAVSGLTLDESVVFQDNITEPHHLDQVDQPIQMVLTDLPYGDLVSWESGLTNPVSALFEHVYPLLSSKGAVVAMIADKSQKLGHARYKRLQHFKVGKRQVAIFEPNRDPEA
ncbi:hypothetical protein [Paenibacillus sp. XY044]|uniref:hypothetical protein n=1 Tax=Paenibacillus sp. XY044 TaxID=2026089 RepID=UPI000B991734|nr:hypothetical protein [Paenibacillus sp. XY044]OZB97991.1 hypothetical protein CJP46_02160 [Paenibacillus sp. XY044]